MAPHSDVPRGAKLERCILGTLWALGSLLPCALRALSLGELFMSQSWPWSSVKWQPGHLLHGAAVSIQLNDINPAPSPMLASGHHFACSPPLPNSLVWATCLLGHFVPQLLQGDPQDQPQCSGVDLLVGAMLFLQVNS